MNESRRDIENEQLDAEEPKNEQEIGKQRKSAAREAMHTESPNIQDLGTDARKPDKDRPKFRVEPQSEETEAAANAKRAQEKASKRSRAQRGLIGADDDRIDRSPEAQDSDLMQTKSTPKK